MFYIFCSCLAYAKARGTRAINIAMQFMYSAGFWLPRSRGVKLGQWLLVFVQCYGHCASLSFAEAKNRFSLIPKLHFVHHEALKLVDAPEHLQWLVSPLATSVQIQEDMVGRPSRLSRRVAVPQLHRRVLDRSLISAYNAILASDKDERGLI